MADEIKEVNSNESVRPSKEYIDDKGEKVIVNDVELEIANLKSVSIGRLETIVGLKDLAAKELCQNCRFWNATENRTAKDGAMIAINGECRVNAPEMTCRTIISGSSDHSSSYWTSQEAGVFPLIGPFQWCGKYEKIA